MKTANLAIVFTDIKGFTARTSEQTLVENERLLSTHNALLEPLFKAFGGRVIKMIGDAFLVTFESPTSAVLAGVAIQDRLWHHNRGLALGQRLDVRVAINVGEVRLENGDVFGEPVNIAARVEGIAEAGEVTFTEAVHLAMNKAEVPAVELGEFELKGIPGKVRVYKVPHAPYRIDAPQLAGEPALAPGAEQPPFGNLGLAKLQDETYKSMVAPELSQRAAELAAQAASLATRAVTAMRRRGLPARPLVVGGALLALFCVGFFALRGSAVERAIADAAGAPRAQRGEKLEAARALIDQEKDAVVRNYYLGELAAADDDGSAVGYYRAAARSGHRGAEDRLIALLAHSRCGFRSAAAESLAELKLTRAKGRLEKLAEKGGDDDGEQLLFIGCNSKNAAAGALRRLEQVK